MTIEERKLSIALQLANNANSILIAQLADRMEECDQLRTIEQVKARVAELEAAAAAAAKAKDTSQ
jgi:hypothetical protein